MLANTFCETIGLLGRRKLLCAIAALCALSFAAIAPLCAQGTTGGWGSPVRLLAGSNSSNGYVELTPLYSEAVPYKYTYRVRNYGLLPLASFVLSLSDDVDFGLLTNPLLAPTGWSAEHYHAVNEDLPYKIWWTPTAGGTPLAVYTGGTGEVPYLDFEFYCYNVPELISSNRIGSASFGYSATTIGPSGTVQYVLDPGSPVPEPSTLLSALGILSPVALLGRRIFSR